jgi:hypothetical protein
VGFTGATSTCSCANRAHYVAESRLIFDIAAIASSSVDIFVFHFRLQRGPGSDPGWFMTKAFTVSGTRLELNVDCSGVQSGLEAGGITASAALAGCVAVTALPTAAEECETSFEVQFVALPTRD